MLLDKNITQEPECEAEKLQFFTVHVGSKKTVRVAAPWSTLAYKGKKVKLTMPMHFFSMLQTLKLFLEIISTGRLFLRDI